MLKKSPFQVELMTSHGEYIYDFSLPPIENARIMLFKSNICKSSDEANRFVENHQFTLSDGSQLEDLETDDILIKVNGNPKIIITSK